MLNELKSVTNRYMYEPHRNFITCRKGFCLIYDDIYIDQKRNLYNI